MSNFSPILPNNFEVDDVKFSYAKTMPNGAKLFFLEYNGEPIYLQSPEMSVTFDPQVFDDESNNTSKFNFKTSVDIDNPSSKVFYEKLTEFDKRLMSLGKENSLEWFKKKNISNDVLESMFTQTIREFVDNETGEKSNKYPPTFAWKLKKKDGKILCRCFDGNSEDKKKEINFNNSEDDDYVKFDKFLKKGALVKGLYKCDFVWHSPGKFGCSWTAQQLRVKAPKGFDSYAFMEDSDEEQENLRTEFINSSDEEDGSVS